MFKKGERIVYPMYGAGVVENIEQRVLKDKIESYYVFRMFSGNMVIRLLTDRSAKVGIRSINKKEKVMDALHHVAPNPAVCSGHWNQRYKEHLEKIKSGNFEEVLEVVRNLQYRERTRGLSGIEKKMLTNAKQIVLSEVICAAEVDKKEAEEMLNQNLITC
ncbi:MAG: CarD family transcriptional regulator [Clostridiales bacterium]|nr:CarD family transcriptional regulator [Clostridiales bacterium]